MGRLDEIRARLAAATPGPWRVAHHGTWEVEAPPHQVVADCGTVDRAEADATLMAHAPDDLAYLLDRLDTLAGLLADQQRAFVEATRVQQERVAAAEKRAEEAEAEVARLRGQVEALSEARDRVALLVPLGEEMAPVEVSIAEYVKRLTKERDEVERLRAAVHDITTAMLAAGDVGFAVQLRAVLADAIERGAHRGDDHG